MTRALVIVIVAAAGVVLSCSGGAQPEWRRGGGPRAGTVGSVRSSLPPEFKPQGPAALRYNDPAAARAPAPTPLGDAIVQVVSETADANGKAAPAPDARLFDVARELAGLMTGDESPPYDIVEFALAHHGIVEPSPHLLVVRANSDDPTAVANELRGKLPALVAQNRFVRIGVGSARGEGDETTVVVALQESGIELEPVARRVSSKGSASLRGRVLHPYEEPRLYVTGTAGRVTEVPLVRDGTDGFRAELRCEGDGRMKIEIVAHDQAHDPSVLANFPIWCGEDPPTRVAIQPGGVGTQVDSSNHAEKLIFELLNEDRRKHGLPALAWGDLAATIAREHSEDMRDNGFVAHVSPTTGTAAERARAGGLATGVVLENIARAYSPEEAQEGLMNSPGHRANLLSPEATHVGVGVALGEQAGELRELYVTQLFYRVNPRMDRADLVKKATEAIVAGRKAAKGGALEWDRQLSDIAQELADGLGEDVSNRALLTKRAGERIDKLGYRFGAVVSVVQVMGDPSQSDEIGKMLDADVRWFGVGAAQGNDPTLGAGAVYVVVLGARPR